jgi:hypothetical protein
VEVTPIGVRLFIQRASGSGAPRLVPNPTVTHQLAVRVISDTIPPSHVHRTFSRPCSASCRSLEPSCLPSPYPLTLTPWALFSGRRIPPASAMAFWSRVSPSIAKGYRNVARLFCTCTWELEEAECFAIVSTIAVMSSKYPGPGALLPEDPGLPHCQQW